MELSSNGTLPTTIQTTTQNDTLTQASKPTSQNWEFLVAVLVTAISISIIIAILAKCQVVRRYLSSYRHTRLREGDSVSHCDTSGMDVEFAMHRGSGMNPHSVPHMGEEDDDDGFIEDNYIQPSERERAERAAEDMGDTEEEEEEEEEEEMDDIEFTIA